MGQKNDKAMKGLRDVGIAVMLLTRLPLPISLDFEDRSPAHAAWAYPLAGALVGAIAASVAWLAGAIGLGPAFQAALALTALVVMTGAMHEDGLADCADGFWGGWDRDRRLKIMRDSNIGAYGVIALGLCLGVRALAYGTLFATGSIVMPLLVAAVLSRAAMVQVMERLPNAREDGLSKSTGRPGLRNVAIGYGIAALVSVAFLGLSALLTVLIAGATAAICGRIALAKIGGQTGDVLGASQQICELAVLLCLVAVL